MGEWKGVVGEFRKPNPPAPFPCREGGARLSPLFLGEGQGEGSNPLSICQQHFSNRQGMVSLGCLGYVHGGLDAWVRSVCGLGLRMGSSQTGVLSWVRLSKLSQVQGCSCLRGRGESWRFGCALGGLLTRTLRAACSYGYSFKSVSWVGYPQETQQFKRR